MTTILCVGDPHFQINNIPEVNMFIEHITILAKEKQPDIIVILGDVLHTHERLHTIALNKAYEFINIMKDIALTYVLVGNHDACNNQIYLSDNHWMNAMKKWENVVIVDNIKYLEINNILLTFVPYVPNGRFEEALNTTGDKWKKSSIIFAHQEFKGCKMGAIISEDGDMWPLDYPSVVSGHIHSRQIPQENIYYTGSALQHAFGESEKNIIAYLTVSEEIYEKEEINLNLPRKKIIYMDVDDIDDYNYDEKIKDKIKITVNGVYEQFKCFKKTKKYKELLNKGVKIVFKQKKMEENNNVEMEQHNFLDILHDIISKENNEHLNIIYKKVIK